MDLLFHLSVLKSEHVNSFINASVWVTHSIRTFWDLESHMKVTHKNKKRRRLLFSSWLLSQQWMWIQGLVYSDRLKSCHIPIVSRIRWKEKKITWNLDFSQSDPNHQGSGLKCDSSLISTDVLCPDTSSQIPDRHCSSTRRLTSWRQTFWSDDWSRFLHPCW